METLYIYNDQTNNLVAKVIGKNKDEIRAYAADNLVNRFDPCNHGISFDKPCIKGQEFKGIRQAEIIRI